MVSDDGDDIGGTSEGLEDAEMTPEEEQKMIDDLVAEQLAGIDTKRDAKLVAVGVEPPPPKKARGAAKKKKVEPAPIAGASVETAERCLKAMQVLRDIGVSDTEFAKVLNVSRATVNNIIHEKRGAQLAGSKAEFVSLVDISTNLRSRLEAVVDMLMGADVEPELLWPRGRAEDTMGLPPEVHAALAEALDATEPDPVEELIVVEARINPDPPAGEENPFADEEENPFAEDDDPFGDESV